MRTPLGGSLAGAVVTVRKGVQTVGAGTSNAAGTFTVGNLRPGTYTLTVARSGYTFTAPATTIAVGPSSAGNTITALTGAGLAPRIPALEGRRKPGRKAGPTAGGIDQTAR